jgi:hypothetical protein
MKKILLFLFVMGIGVGLLAQSTYSFKLDPRHKDIYEGYVIDKEPVKEEAITSAKVKQSTIPDGQRDAAAISIIDIGTSANAWTYNSNNAGNQKSIVWHEPELGIVTNFHRDGGDLNPTAFSGDYTYDISFDNGSTWTNNIKCYIAVNNSGGSDGDASRYPSHGIYNPTGEVEDAYVAFFGPNLDGSNSNTPGAGWGGYTHGVANISDPTDTTGNYNTRTSNVGDGVYQYIPDAFEVSSLGLAMTVDVNVNWTSGAGVYEGALTRTFGEWDDDEMDIVYDQELWDYETDLEYGSPWFTSIAWAPDGLTGYVAFLGNNGETWNTGDMRHSIYPLFYKTIDGGENWEGPTAIQIDGPDGIGGIVDHLLTDEQIASIYVAPVPERDEIPYTFLGDFEIACSAGGNLLVAGVIAAAGESTSEGGISFFVEQELGALMLLYTTDGGETFFAEEMGRTYQYTGTWGDMLEANRTQITTSADGTKVFVSWLDNDTEDEPDNSRPNIYCRGMDLMTGMKTRDLNETDVVDGPTNVTYFSLAWNQALFGTVAKTAIDVDGGWEMAYTYGQLTDNDPGLPTQWKYIQGFQYMESDFMVTGINDPIDAQANNATVSQNYPNPFSGQSSVTVTLEEGADLSLEVFSLTGQLVSLNQYGYTPQGTTTLTIDGADLVPGVYFYTVTAGETKVTQKMIVE